MIWSIEKRYNNARRVENLGFVMWLKKKENHRLFFSHFFSTYWLHLCVVVILVQMAVFVTFLYPSPVACHSYFLGFCWNLSVIQEEERGQSLSCWNCVYSALGNNEKIHLTATMQLQDCPSGLKYRVSFHFALRETPEGNYFPDEIVSAVLVGFKETLK